MRRKSKEEEIEYLKEDRGRRNRRVRNEWSGLKV